MSLLLDALRQAEKNKDGKSIETFEDSKADNNLTLADDKDSNLVELNVLPDYELTDGSIELEKQPFTKIQPGQETELKITPEVSSEKDDIICRSESEESIESVTTTTESASKPETSLKETQLETKTAESPPKSAANEQTQAVPPQSQASERQAPPTLALTEETAFESNAEAAKNVIEVSSSRVKPVYWLILLIVIAFLAAAYYLYSLTVPPVYQENQSDLSELGMIDESEWSIEETQPGNTTVTSVTTQHSSPETTYQPAVKTDRAAPSQALSVMAAPEQITHRPAVNSQNTNNQFSQFTVEPTDDQIDYPQGVKIKVKRQQSSEFIQINRAYSAYQNQDYTTAKRLYTKILQKNQSNIDALNAMGDMEMKTGQTQRAKVFFEKVLQYDGNQLFAKQALIRLQKSQSPQAQESLYKSLIDSYPEKHQTYATLANLYLSQKRWREAQSNYFKAVELNPDNPDYQYNLAICLDHLNKPDIALRYYQKAFQLSQSHKALFDTVALSQRIQQLKGN